MQIFVRKADLTTSPVVIVAQYPDLPLMAVDAHTNCTRLSLPQNAIDVGQKPPYLTTDFRTYMPQMVNSEAERRINIPFPEYMQRNANADQTASLTKYGPDPSTWPSDAKARKAENDRGWAYVQAVRAASDGMVSNITINDPTDDSHWPAPITPVYVPPPA